jgi:hypothetical protein
MRRRLGGLMVALLGTLVTHVAEAAVEATLDSNGQPPADYVRTPNGYFHKSCVHDVPNGAQVDDNDNVTTNGVVTHFEPCQYPVISTPSASLASSAPSPTIGHAWVESIEQDQSGQGFNLLEVNSQIPGIPCYPGDQQTIYLFNGLEPVFNAFPLIQPVIGYVYLSGNTGTQLEIAAWWLTLLRRSGRVEDCCVIILASSSTPGTSRHPPQDGASQRDPYGDKGIGEVALRPQGRAGRPNAPLGS